ncbi:hypothetical protein V6U77_29875, partial [Micromonospora sp. CPCC 205546]|uniref:SpnB-like Rossmann fold domain-containing protein n=1 Tax=Micromonospora sp. CPCC 205546 TaxID=3122397 RepID=UPI003B5E59D9
QHDGDHYAEIAVDGLNSDGYLLHPALLDAALQPVVAGRDDVLLPYSFHKVELHGTDDATQTHVSGTSVTIADGTGAPLLTVRQVTMRARVTQAEELLWVRDWQPIDLTADADLIEAAVLDCSPPAGETVPARVRAQIIGALEDLQAWLGRRGPDDRLAVVTRRAVTVDGDDIDLVQAPIWGLVRTAQLEHPGCITLLDLGEDDAPPPAALRTTLPEIAVRRGETFAPGLVHPKPGLPLCPGAWRLDATGGGLDGLTVVAGDADVVPLAAGQVRVEVHAAGLNFHDVAVVLNLIDDVDLGQEGAGVVVESASDAFRPGDRVLGLFGGAFGS